MCSEVLDLALIVTVPSIISNSKSDMFFASNSYCFSMYFLLRSGRAAGLFPHLPAPRSGRPGRTRSELSFDSNKAIFLNYFYVPTVPALYSYILFNSSLFLHFSSTFSPANRQRSAHSYLFIFLSKKAGILYLSRCVDTLWCGCYIKHVIVSYVLARGVWSGARAVFYWR